jgi:heme/copper-type cytochrome/quinol oxidase subunit 4
MKYWVGFFSGTALYLVAFFGYVLGKMEVSVSVTLAIIGAILMLGSILCTFLEPNQKSREPSPDYHSMMRYFFLIACLVVVHALAENTLDWKMAEPEIQSEEPASAKHSELW